MIIMSCCNHCWQELLVCVMMYLIIMKDMINEPHHEKICFLHYV